MMNLDLLILTQPQKTSSQEEAKVNSGNQNTTKTYSSNSPSFDFLQFILNAPESDKTGKAALTAPPIISLTSPEVITPTKTSESPKTDKDDSINFLSQITDIPTEDIQEEIDPKILERITSLTNEIRSLLKLLKSAAPETPLTVSKEETTSTPETQIFQIYALILNEIEPQANVETTPAQSINLETLQIPITEQTPLELIQSIAIGLKTLAEKPDSLHILGNMKPEDLTKLQDSLNRILDGKQTDDDLKMLESFAAQIVTLSPPIPKREEISLPVNTSEIQISDKKMAQPQDTPSPKLPDQKSEYQNNAEKIKTAPTTSEIMGQKNTQIPKHFTQERFENRYDLSNIKDRAPYDKTQEAQPQDLKAEIKIIPDQKMTATTLLRLVSSNSTEMRTFGLQTSTETGSTGGINTLSNPQQSSLTNVITQSQSASAPHPATQMVAASITRAVKGGEDTTIKLQLDPPELGRVEVKMSIDKDARVKIILSAEKQDTLNLLQRDSQILDRALQNAGLDTSQSSMSFELAQQGQDFKNNSGGNSKNLSGKNSTLSDSEENVMETIMNWRMDPNTGHMRYNALV